MGLSRAGFEEADQFEKILVLNNLGTSKLDLAANARKFFLEECVQNNTRGAILMPFGFHVALSNAAVVEDQKWLSVKFVVDFSPDQDCGVQVGKFPVAVNFAFRKGFSSDSGNKTCLSLTYPEVDLVVKHARPVLRKWIELGGEVRFDSPNEVPLPRDVVLRETEKTDKATRRIVLFSISMLKKPAGSHAGVQEGSIVASIREYAEDVRRNVFVPTKSGVCLGLRALYMLCFPVMRMSRAWHDAFLGLAMTESNLCEESTDEVAEIESILSKGLLSLKEGEMHPLDKDELKVKTMEGLAEGEGDSDDDDGDDVSDDDFLSDMIGTVDVPPTE